jgi:PAS domain S-box-containing protein
MVGPVAEPTKLVLTSRPVATLGSTDVTASRSAPDLRPARITPSSSQTPQPSDYFRDLFENARDFMYTTDLAGILTSINRAGELLTGYTRDEVMGSSILRILAPEHLALGLQMTDPETARGDHPPYELDIVTKDGRKVPLEVRTGVIHCDGHPVGIHGIARDKTLRMQSDADIRRRAAHLEALNVIIGIADAAPDLPRLLTTAIDRTLDVLGLCVGGIWADNHHAVRSLPPEIGPAIVETVKTAPPEVPSSQVVEDWSKRLFDTRTGGDPWRQLGVHSSLTVPILVDSRCIGAFAVASRQPRAWLRAEVAFVEAVAQQVGATAEGLRLFHDIQPRAELMKRLVALSESLNRPAPVARVVVAIGQAALSLTNTQRAAVCLHHPDGTATCSWSQGVSEDIVRMVTSETAGPWPRLAGIAEPVRIDTLGGQTCEVTRPTLISDVRELPSGVRSLAEGEGILAIGVWPLTYEGRVIASVSCYYDACDAPHAWSQPEKEAIQTFGWQAAAALENARLYEAERKKAKELEQAYIEMVLALSRAMDARDAYTADHSERLASWVDSVARSLGCRDEEIQDVRWGALLHDIGKIGVPDHVLRKPGSLNDEELAAMRLHPIIGERILLPAARLGGVANVVRHHHERWDGTGYPDRLVGKAIPLGARILAVADAYGAIIDARPYKTARSHEEAMSELMRSSGTQFDPEIVEAFCQMLERQQIEADSGVRRDSNLGRRL